MHLSELIKRRQFVITCEIDPPKGVDVNEFLDKVNIVKGSIDALNIGDNERAVMRASSLAVCRILKEQNIEPIMGLTARYRNRIAVQSDMLGAAILGVENLLLLAGYDPSVGDHAEAESVYDLDSVSLVSAAITLQKGQDMTGHDLNEAPEFCLGVLATPELEGDESDLVELKEKIALGVDFIQTQPVYDPAVLERFVESISSFNVPVIVGHMMLKSASMARFINSNLPGVTVPERVIEELEGLPKDRAVERSLELSIEILTKMKPVCQGISFTPAGWERYIPRIVEAIGVPRSVSE